MCSFVKYRLTSNIIMYRDGFPGRDQAHDYDDYLNVSL